MTIEQYLWQFRPFWAPAGDPPPADPPPADPPADPPPADPPADPPPADPPAGAWWDGEAFKEVRDHVVKSGLTTEDRDDALLKAITMHKGAETMLGGKAEGLLQKPKDGQDLGEYLRANAETFGIPESAEAYDLGIDTENLPAGVGYDAKLDGAVREVAFQHGIGNSALKALAGAYTEHLAKVEDGINTEYSNAKAELDQKLQADWGDQYNAKVNLAQRAAQFIGEKAGLDSAGLELASQALAAKGGDASTLRMFAAIGEMLGEDTLITGGAPQHLGGMTPAEAKAELERFISADGDYGKAAARNDKKELARLDPKREQLIRLASQAA